MIHILENVKQKTIISCHTLVEMKLTVAFQKTIQFTYLQVELIWAHIILEKLMEQKNIGFLQKKQLLIKIIPTSVLFLFLRNGKKNIYLR